MIPRGNSLFRLKARGSKVGYAISVPTLSLVEADRRSRCRSMINEAKMERLRRVKYGWKVMIIGESLGEVRP